MTKINKTILTRHKDNAENMQAPIQGLALLKAFDYSMAQSLCCKIIRSLLLPKGKQDRLTIIAFEVDDLTLHLNLKYRQVFAF